jgi:hypothetical protein
MADRIAALLDAEWRARDMTLRENQMLAEDFAALRVKRPRLITVNFSGGVTRKCYLVARSNGAYTLVYLPTEELFSLCVDSIFGPVDIGVHGPALDCFSSV